MTTRPHVWEKNDPPKLTWDAPLDIIILRGKAERASTNLLMGSNAND